MIQFDPRKHRTTLRLTFRFDGGHVELAHQERVEMLAPPSPVAPPVAGKSSGFWVELRDGDDHVLFYRILHNPIPFVIDLHSPNKQIQAISGAPGRGEFEVLLPDLPGAASVVLFSSPLDLKRSMDPATELARFPLERSTAVKGVRS